MMAEEKAQNHLYWLHKRKLPVGAEPFPEGVHFRLWAPRCSKVEVVLEGANPANGAGQWELIPEMPGYHALLVPDIGAGALYRFRIGGEGELLSDPASRFQPQGPFGPSEVIDSSSFAWTDAAWPGIGLDGQILYEMHIGTFTRDGTWAAAAHELPELAAAGLSVLELMPVADFPGQFGWGYDAVNLFAPCRLYGGPDDFRHFVDRAHSLGMGVILDLVMNHVGGIGNFLDRFSDDYFIQRHHTEWGRAMNFEGENSGPVREFFLALAGYWISEYHIDGYRIDATQQIFDSVPDHILSAVTRQTRESAGRRTTLIIAENEAQETRPVKPQSAGGFGMDAIWNDDFHHSSMVALTGHNEGYYTDYLGRPQEFVSLAKWGFLYQGQRYRWQRKRRGAPALELRPATFVNYLQNHDQVANSAHGRRCHDLTSPGLFRALTSFFLLGPWTPLIFQGQEFGATSPFHYFADLDGESADRIAAGRAQFLSQFRSLSLPQMQAIFPRPTEVETFERCKLDLTERKKHAHIYALHRDLLALRRREAVFTRQHHGSLDGAVLAEEAFVLRFFDPNGDDRLMVVNLGRDLHLDPAPEPLLAPPEKKLWMILWSSEDPRYGGSGTWPLDTEENWRIPGQATVILRPETRPREESWQS